jgi:NADH:ubiquinone oxidoreductase subunit 5 (subunit L)/multisubunit Na+/H+ antiporter MnhA subunit
VAVLLSGATLNAGLYGMLRIFLLAGPVEEWWGYALMGLGAFSGVVGILLGCVQSDIKRTLAYSSAENMGIICLALGGALIAGKNGSPTAAALLMAGAFLHIWNHSIFKSLLFLAANAVKEHTHTTLIQKLGGLQKSIPFTGGCFALGSAAIAGVPPLNGFMSELLIFMGLAFAGGAAATAESALLFWGAFFVLGGIAGMALFAFVRAYGLTFLGTSRSRDCLRAREPESLFKAAMLFLVLMCPVFSLVGSKLLAVFKPALLWLAVGLHLDGDAPVGLGWYAAYTNGISLGDSVLVGYAKFGLGLAALFVLVFLAQRKILDKNGVTRGGTWACGYHCPTARMQYSGASFSRSLALLLKPVTRTGVRMSGVKGLFPKDAELAVTSPDWITALWASLIFSPAAAVAEVAKNLQTGLVNLYVFYVFFALVAALTWALGWA